MHSDERGSVVAVTNSSGTTLNVNRYDEYGIPSSGNAGRFQYTGQTWLPELGMYYYKARIYSPTLGRFLQTDPIGYGDGMNMYDYVGGDPVNLTDPLGLQGDVIEPDIFVTGKRPQAPELLGWGALMQGRGGFDARFMDNVVNIINGGSGGNDGVGGPEEPICKGPPTPPGANRERLA